MISTASAGSSVTRSRSTSSGEIIPSARSRSRIQSTRPRPVVRAEEDDGEVRDLPRLDQRQRLEELVERAEAAREDDEALGGLHEHRLADVEVPEGQGDVEVRVRELLVRELDVEPDRDAAALLGAAVRGLHDPGAAAGDDREVGPGEPARGLARRLVGGVALADPRRAEDRDGRAREVADGLEPSENSSAIRITRSRSATSSLERIRSSSTARIVALLHRRARGPPGRSPREARPCGRPPRRRARRGCSRRGSSTALTPP